MDQQQRFDEGPGGLRPARSLVTCERCGCRLRRDDAAEASEQWFHFSPLGGRDARGCRIDCADAAHDAFGAPILVFA